MNTKNKPFDLAIYLSPDSRDLDAELEICRELGVSSVGFNGWAAWRDANAIRKTGGQVRAHGMKVASYHSSIGLCWPDDIDKSFDDNRRIIDCAAGWECPSTVWHYRWPRSRVGDTHFISAGEMGVLNLEEIDRAMDKVLLPTCDYAVSRGVSVNLENLPLLPCDPYTILEFIHKFNHPGLGFILDSNHAWIDGYDPAEAVRAAGPLLRDTHFHDSMGSRYFPKGRRIKYEESAIYAPDLVPGLGTICWMEVVRALRETGFPGPVMFEAPQIIGDPAGYSVAGLRRRFSLTIDMWRAFEDMATGCPEPAPVPANR